MKIKHNDVEINAEHPFQNCQLGRKEYADTLTTLVQNYRDGFVLAVNSQWGTGKTTFIKMWKQDLINKEFKTVYFNAWENDFDAEPLTALIAELNTLVRENKSEKTFKSLIQKGAILSKNVLPGVVKAIAKKYIGEEVVADLAKDTAKAATEIMEKEVDDYIKKKKGLTEFKISLEKFVKESINDDKPLVFIIDELDRCRPNYAVEILEKIKHFFTVPGIVFVLSIDKTQLEYAIKGVYGSDHINAEDYLRRFIDVEYSLPEPATKKIYNYLFDYFDFNAFFLSDSRKKYNAFTSDKASFISMASNLLSRSDITLRQKEKVFAHARMALSLFEENSYVFPQLYLMLIVIKQFYKDFYNNIQNRSLSVQDVIDTFSVIFLKNVDEENRRSFIYLESLLVHLYNNYWSKQREPLFLYDSFTQQQTTKLISKMDLKQHNFISFLKSISGQYDYSDTGIDYILNKINLIGEVK